MSCITIMAINVTHISGNICTIVPGLTIKDSPYVLVFLEDPRDNKYSFVKYSKIILEV